VYTVPVPFSAKVAVEPEVIEGCDISTYSPIGVKNYMSSINAKNKNVNYNIEKNLFMIKNLLLSATKVVVEDVIFH
jgi:hypothetical protein